MKKQNNKGITLIALVITIIVLIILASVSINLLFGGEGIISKTKEGAQNYLDAEQEERNILTSYEDTMESEITGITTYKDSQNKVAKIPAGFTVSANTGETEIDTGLVVIAPDGSEFVWVPVANPVLDVQGMNDTQINTAIGAEVTAGRYPMAIKINATDYKGVLYSFSGTSSVTVTAMTYSSTETGYREPAYLTDTEYADASSYNTVGITQSLLQTEYNAMVSNVIKRGGFYIGRYETSLNVVNAQSKANVASMVSINWYSMYEKQKLYVSNNNITGMTSGMIWGSQWDQVMIWMKDITNPNASDKPYILDATGMGNYSGTKTNTGVNNNYKVKNIYDMAGNVYDWTMQANRRLFSRQRKSRSWRILFRYR